MIDSYYIRGRKRRMTYMELRLLMEVECDAKIKKISEILSFLYTHNFLANLIVFSVDDFQSENIVEKDDIMSLTIDMVEDKMRFKFWNGVSSMWLFHTQDLFDALNTGREEFSDIYDKYEEITDILLNFKKRWSTSIAHISYRYHPTENTDVSYHIVFSDGVKQTDSADEILNKINKELQKVDSSVIDGLKFDIQYSYKPSGCTECEKKRKEREQNEN